MEVIYNTIQTTLNSFDFAFCIAVNVLTYLLISIITKHKNKNLGVWKKRLVLLVSIIIVGSLYTLGDTDIKLILNSSIIAPVFWSWVIKPICKFFKLDYKDINLFE